MRISKKKIGFVLLALVVGYVLLAIVAWCIVPKKLADAEQRLFGVRLAIVHVEQDQILLSQRIRAVTDQTLGKGLGKEAEVIGLLSDPDINHLALVYLGADWATQRSGLMGAVRHLREVFNMQKVDRQGVIDRRKERGEERLRMVKELERRKKSLGLQLAALDWRSMSAHSKRIELEDVERQLALYRDRHAYWDTQERDAVRQDQQEETFSQARAKMEAEVFRLASDYQTMTVGTLARVLAEKLGDLKTEANRPTHLRRLMSPFNIWPINMIGDMPLEDRDAKQL